MISKQCVFTGTQVNYYVICPTKLWYFSHFIRQERESDAVAMGRVIHEASYAGAKKEIMIDSRISIDFMKRGGKLLLHDIKKSNKMEDAHVCQLLYYLYYLKQKGVDAEGVIDYPKLRKTKSIILTEDNETRIKDILRNISDIVSMEKPPEPEKRKMCRKCSYFEFCWVK